MNASVNMNRVDIQKKKLLLNLLFLMVLSCLASISCLDIQDAFVNRKALIFYSKKNLSASNAFFFGPSNVTSATESRFNTNAVLMTPYSRSVVFQ